MASDRKMFDDYWASVDEDVRLRAVEILRENLPSETLEQIREGVEKYGSHEWIHEEPFTTYDEVVFDDGEVMTLPNVFHHGYGMAIRNLLRQEGLTDDLLPDFDAYYGEGTGVRNWDDGYIQALEEAARS